MSWARQSSEILSTTRSWFFLCIVLLPAANAAADSESRDWLDRMDVAVEYLNYEGTLVHMRAGHVDSYRIFHRVADGTVTERLVALDGVGREIIRNQDEVTCIFPDRRAVIVEKRRDRDSTQSPLRASLPAWSESVSRYYALSMVGADRVADRTARVLAIQPTDRLRYGYRIWLDVFTAMPLKSQLRSDESDMPIEEIMFASISMPEFIPEKSVQPSLITESFSRIRADIDEDGVDPRSDDPGWHASDLPPGFMHAATHFEYLDDGESPRLHIVYTDGLASVSVFIEAAVAASEQAEGHSTIGAANAYSWTIDGQQVTAVGQVPMQTVQLIARGVRRGAGAGN